MPTVFLSSVARGLEPYRQAVYKAINRLDGYKCVGMEDFGARDGMPLDTCLAKARECDIFVGIVGNRYGSIAPETGKSFSESEYDAALSSGKPMLMFLTPEEFPVPANLIESDEIRERQKNFRAIVSQKHVVGFFEKDQEEMLGSLVVQAIHNRRSKAVKEGIIVQGPVVTKLLFPFVTNQAGFDTGIAISNISDDPFGTEKQEGTCTIYYYGHVTGGGAAPKPQTSNLLRAGEQLNCTMSNGGSHLIGNTPGFQGYVIAECRFKAAGLGFISDVGAQRIGSCYIAQIM
jgi:Domain of unknown function (DUF4062)